MNFILWAFFLNPILQKYVFIVICRLSQQEGEFKKASKKSEKQTV